MRSRGSDRRRRAGAGRRAPWGGRLVLAGVLAGATLVSLLALVLLSPPGAGPAAALGGPFALTQGDGRQVTDRDFRGKFLLVYFGYTSCPDVCPTTLSEVSAAIDRLGARAGAVQPLFITVDPGRDTAAVVGAYAASFPHLVGLTGTPDEIGAVARAYRIRFAPHRTGVGPVDYTVDHSSILYLVGPDGGVVEPIPADAAADVIAAHVLRRLS